MGASLQTVSNHYFQLHRYVGILGTFPPFMIRVLRSVIQDLKTYISYVNMAPVEVNVCANEAEVVSSLAKLIESKASECLNKNNFFRVGLSGNNDNFCI